MFLFRFLLIGFIFLLTSCSFLEEKGYLKRSHDSTAIVSKAINKPLDPKQTDELVKEAGKNIVYGNGLGEMALAAGITFIFPPYGVYSVGNAMLNASGYEELRVSKILPGSGEDIWNDAYENITSVPGRVTSSVAGEEYRNPMKAKESIERVLSEKIK